jgi:hypothetical protein
MTPTTRRSARSAALPTDRLGFALQLTTVRFLGTFLEDPTAVPTAVIATITRRLGIDPTTDLIGYRDSDGVHTLRFQ